MMKKFAILFTLLFVFTELTVPQAIPDIMTVMVDGQNIPFTESTYTYYVDVELSLGQTFELYCKAENDGPDDSPAGYNNINFSFPNLTSSSSIYNVDINFGGTSSDMEDNYFDVVGWWNNNYYPYLQAESSDDNGWDGTDGWGNEENELTVNVEPTAYGTFVINFRVNMSNQQSWQYGWNHAPSWSPYTDDPLGHYVYRIYVDVINPDTEPDCWINSPSSSITLLWGENETFEIGASDVNCDLDEVRWYKNGSYQTTHSTWFGGCNSTDDWSTSFSSGSSGTVMAVVYDDYGNTCSKTWIINLQQPTGTINIDVTSPSGTPMDGVKVWQYNTSWSWLDEEITISNGRATFNNVPINNDYHFEAHNPTPIWPSENEYWGTVMNVSVNSNGATTTNQIQRYMPYSYQIDIKDMNGNLRSSFEQGETVEIIIRVSNDATQNHSVKVQCQADRDMTGSIDFDETSAYETIPDNDINLYSFYFTPTEQGDYHVRPKATRTWYNNTDQLTDSWDFGSYVNFTVTAPTGNIYIDVTNQGTLWDGVTVHRHNYDWSIEDSKVTNSSGQASWINMIPAGVLYHFSAYNPTPILPGQSEYWGYVTDISVNSFGGTTTTSIQRFMPYSYQIRIQDINGNPQSTFEIGQSVQVIIDVSNEENYSNMTKVHCQVDRDKTGSMDFNETSPYSNIQPNAVSEYVFTFTPQDIGDYFVRPLETIIQESWGDILTDSWDFAANPSFSVIPGSGTININITNHIGDPVSGVTVHRHNYDWSVEDSRVTNEFGQASWSNMITSGVTYHFSAYNPTPVIPGQSEYWGYETDIVVNSIGGTAYGAIQRFMPYSQEIRIEDINGNPKSSFELNQTVRILIDVRNNEYISNDVKVHCQASCDQTGDIEFDETTVYQSVQSNQVRTYEFLFQPTAIGDYHVRPYETITFDNNADVLTDSWDFGTYINFTVTSASGTIHVDIKSPSGDFMGGVDVLRYYDNLNGDWEYIDYLESNSSGRASWINLIAIGVDYHFDAYMPNPNSSDREFWGSVSDIVVPNVGGVTYTEIERYMPYTYMVETKTQNGDPQTSFELGEEVQMIIHVSNDDVTPHDIKVRCIADKDKIETWDFESTSIYQNVPGLTCAWHTFSYTPTEIGDYFIRPIETFTYYNNNDVVTDTWAFGTNPNFSITPNISVTNPSIDLTVNQGDNVEIQWNAGNPAGVEVILYADIDEIYGNGNEILIADQLSPTDYYNWETTSFAPGLYHIVGVAEYSPSNYDYDYADGTVQITGSYNIELELFMISDNTGDANSNDPGNAKTVFIPGETVRVTMMASNTGASADVQCVLNIRGADDQTWVYDSHPMGQDNSYDSPLTFNEIDYYSFDWQIPIGYYDYGSHDVGSSIRNEFDFNILYETTCNGSNTAFNCDWILHDEFSIIDGGILELPHYHQGISNWCAYNSVSMILKYYNLSIKPWEVAHDPLFYSSIEEGPSPYWINFWAPHVEDIKDYIQQKLPNSQVNKETFYTGSFDPIFNSIQKILIKSYIIENLSYGRPIWVGSAKAGHVCVIVGASNDKIILNDPSGAWYNTTTELINIERPWADFFDQIFYGFIDLYAYFITIENPPLPSQLVPGTISLLSYANFSSAYHDKPTIIFNNEVNNSPHSLFLQFDGSENNNNYYGYIFLPVEYETSSNEYIPGNPDNHYNQNTIVNYSAGLDDNLNINIEYASLIFSNSGENRSYSYSVDLYEIDNNGTPVSGAPISLLSPTQFNLFENYWTLSSINPFSKRLAKVLDPDRDGYQNNVYGRYMLEFKLEHNNIKIDSACIHFVVENKNYAWLEAEALHNEYNLTVNQNNEIQFSVSNLGLLGNDQPILRFFLGQENGSIIPYEVYEANENYEKIGSPLQKINNTITNLIQIPENETRYFVIEAIPSNPSPIVNVVFSTTSQVDPTERVDLGNTVFYIFEEFNVNIVYNSLEGEWRNFNSQNDIDFLSNNNLYSIKYQINSNDNSNPSNWSELSSDGISYITQFSGTSFTDDWMINNTDWGNLQLNAQTQGWHYIYFKVEDAAGNIYITPTQDEAFKFGKDEFAPSCHFVLPENNQILNSTTVTVEWYVSDILLGLPMSGVSSIYYRIDNEQSFTQADPIVSSITYNDLTTGPHTVYLYATDNAGNQTTIEELNFSIDLNINPPDPFALSSPSDGDLITNTSATLTWETSIDPDGTDVDYEVWYDYDPTFTNATIEQVLSGTQTILNNLNDNSYIYWKVKAIDESGEVRWSNQTDWSFIINTQNDPPQAFNLNEPLNSATLLDWSPYFDWSNSIDPDPDEDITYYIWYGTDPIFTLGTYEEHTCYYSEHSHSGNLLANTTYYWKVKAVDNNGGITWSTETDWWFTTPNHPPEFVWTGIPGYESDGVNPDQGDNTTQFIFNITYKDQDNNDPASGYPLLHLFKDGVELSGSPYAMTTSSSQSFTIGKEYEASVSGLDPGIDYTYYFEAYDNFNGLATGNGTSFNVGPEVKGLEINTPDGGEFWYANQNYNIEWDFIGSFDTYDIFYSFDDGQSYQIVQSGISGNIPLYEWVVPNTPSQNCRVCVVGYYSNSAVSDTSENVFEIHTAVDPPLPFNLLSPYDIELTTNEPTFYWEPTTDPDGTNVSYEVWYTTDNNYLNKITQGGLPTPEYTPPPLQDNTKYYWKVKAEDENGQVTWSNQQDWYFYVNTENNAPNAFSLIQPDDGITTNTLFPEFKWSASYDVDPLDTVNYVLWVGTNNQFAPGTYEEYYTDTTAKNLTDPLNINTYYYWKVKAIDNHGAETWCFEDHRWFITPSCFPLYPGEISDNQTICSSVTPQILSLTNNPSGGSGNVTYQWQHATDTNSFADIQGATSQSYQPPALTQSTYYRIKFFDPGSCGDVFSNFILISVYDELMASQITGDQTVCYQTTPGPISTSIPPSGGFGSYTITWQDSIDGGQWSTISGETNDTLVPGVLTDTTYFRQMITDQCGSAYSNGVVINVVPLPLANAGPDTTVCEDQSILIESASAEYYSSVLWSGGYGSFNDSTIVNATYIPGQADIASGSVVLTMEAFPITPCSSSTQSIILINFQELPSAFAGPDTTICENQYLDIILANASSYSSLEWSGGYGSFSDSTQLWPTYYPDPADITAGTITLTLSAYPLSPCVNPEVSTFNLSFQELPIADAGPDEIICENGIYQPPASASNYSSVAWSSGGNGTFNDSTLINPIYTPSVNDITTGSVYLYMEAFPSGNCSVSHTDSMLLTFQYLPIADAGPDTAYVCENLTYQANGTPFNESGVVWNSINGDGSFSNDSINNPVYTPGNADIAAGQVMLTYTTFPMYPCTSNDTDTLMLLIQYLPSADAGIDTTICEGSSYTLSGTATYFSSVLWSTNGYGTFNDSTSLNATYTPGYYDILNGSVDLILTANPESPCINYASDSITLSIVRAPVAQAPEDDTICETATQYNPIGSTLANFSWFIWEIVPGQAFGTIQNPQTTTPKYFIDSLDIVNGSFSLVLNAYSSFPYCPVSSDTLNVYFIYLPEVYAGEDDVICITDSLPVSATVQNSNSVSWTTNGSGYFENPDTIYTYYYPHPDDATSSPIMLFITAESTPPCNEEITDTIELEVVPLPTCNAGDDQTICADDSCFLIGQANNYDSVHWTAPLGHGYFIQPDSLNAIYVPAGDDFSNGVVNIQLHASSISPCNTDTLDEIWLFINELPDVDAGQDVTVTYNNSYQLNGFVSGGSGNFTIEWKPASFLNNPNILNPIAQNLTQTTTFILTATDQESNCANEDSVILTVYPEGTMFIISGQVFSETTNTPMESVEIEFTGQDTTCFTLSDGSYEGSVQSGWTGYAKPEYPGYIFEPDSILFEYVGDSIYGQDFIGRLFVEATASPRVANPNTPVLLSGTLHNPQGSVNYIWTSDITGDSILDTTSSFTHYPDWLPVTYTLTVKDNYDYSYDTAIVALAVITSEIKLNNIKIELFPNPVRNTLFIRCTGINGPLRFSMIDLNGSSIYNKKTSGEFGKFESEIEMKGYPSGIYLFKITDINSKQSIVEKVIKLR